MTKKNKRTDKESLFLEDMNWLQRLGWRLKFWLLRIIAPDMKDFSN